MNSFIRTSRYFYSENYNAVTTQPLCDNDSYNIMFNIGNTPVYNSSGPTKLLSKAINLGDGMWEEDMRLPMIIRMSQIVSDEDAIFRYTTFLSLLMHQHPTYRAYAQYGLIPLAFFPTERYSYMSQLRNHYLSKYPGKQIYNRPFIYLHNVQTYIDRKYDLWVSRFDAADILGCNPEAVKTPNLLKEVLK